MNSLRTRYSASTPGMASSALRHVMIRQRAQEEYRLSSLYRDAFSYNARFSISDTVEDDNGHLPERYKAYRRQLPQVTYRMEFGDIIYRRRRWSDQQVLPASHASAHQKMWSGFMENNVATTVASAIILSSAANYNKCYRLTAACYQYRSCLFRRRAGFHLYFFHGVICFQAILRHEHHEAPGLEDGNISRYLLVCLQI